MSGLKRRAVMQAGVGAALLPWAGRARAEGPDVPADLAAAAKKEGRINVITLPRDWANWGTTMDRFQALYGVTLEDANPDGSSAEELQAIRGLKSQERAPDVVDVGPSFAISGAREKLFAPYKVAQWDQIPDDVKQPDGMWYGDYFGVEAFAVNTSVAKVVPQTWTDLKKPDYKGMVAMNGNPLGAGAAFGAVFAAALANGGSYDDIEPGIHFFAELAQLGNLNPAAASPASLIAGQTPVVINWDYLSLGYKKQAAGKAESTCWCPRRRRPTATSTARRSAPTRRTPTPPSCGWNTSIPTRANWPSSAVSRTPSASTAWWPRARCRRRCCSPCLQQRPIRT